VTDVSKRPVVERVTALAARVRGTTTKWLDGWTAEVDEALAELPPMTECSHEHFKQLACNSLATPKRLGISYRDGRPVAVLSVRARKGFWEPVTAACTPGAILPAADGQLVPALRGSGLYVHIAELFGDPAAMHPTTTHVWPVHRARLDAEYEAYWKSTDLWRNVRYSRNRTAHLTVAVDQSGDVEWTIDRWRDSWADDHEQLTVAADDMKLSTLLLRDQGRVTTVTIRDGDVRVAGSINIHRGEILHSYSLARDLDRPKERLGNRILDLTFEVGRDKGFRYFDLGGLVDYKSEWAPPDGERSTVEFIPTLLRIPPAVKRRLSRAKSMLRKRA
jgi:hypothetical protein